jgi:hypothetical protein
MVHRLQAKEPPPMSDHTASPEVSKFTPGTWRIEGRRGAGYIISAGVNAEGDGPAAYVGVIDPMFHVAGEDTERREADARLIAAAPELLAALKEAVEEVEDLRNYANNHGGMFDDKLCDYGRAAIARAEV